jgi:hypothetical protein
LGRKNLSSWYPSQKREQENYGAFPSMEISEHKYTWEWVDWGGAKRRKSFLNKPFNRNAIESQQDDTLPKIFTNRFSEKSYGPSPIIFNYYTHLCFKNNELN